MLILQNAPICSRVKFFCEVPADPSDLDYAAPFLVTSESHVRIPCQNPMSDTAECAKFALNTAVDVYQWFREVCSTRLINDGPVIRGGTE